MNKRILILLGVVAVGLVIFLMTSKSKPTAVLVVDNVELSGDEAQSLITKVFESKSLVVKAIVLGDSDVDRVVPLTKLIQNSTSLERVEYVLSDRISLYLSRALDIYQNDKAFKTGEKVVIFVPSRFPSAEDILFMKQGKFKGVSVMILTPDAIREGREPTLIA